jgi:molybdopterin-containing oxidoreductase family membrane subunit
MKEKSGGLVAVFSSLDSVLSAVRLLKEKGIRVNTVYSPSRNEELSDALEVKPSPVRWFTLTGGILGILFGYGLAAFASSKWNFIVSGKPTIPIVPFVIISFEFCILFSVFATLLGIAIHARIPRFRLPVEYDPRFSRDHYGLVVDCGEEETGRIRDMLLQSGASEAREITPEIGEQRSEVSSGGKG